MHAGILRELGYNKGTGTNLPKNDNLNCTPLIYHFGLRHFSFIARKRVCLRAMNLQYNTFY